MDIPPPSELKREMTLRPCVTCTQSLPEEAEAWRVQCLDCFRNPANKRECAVCLDACIPSYEPEWRKVCNACWRESEKRKCKGCARNVIPSYEPTWKKICGPCFSDKSRFRSCGTCQLKKILPGTPRFMKQCSSCYVGKG